MKRIKKFFVFLGIILIIGLGSYVAYDVYNKYINKPKIVQVYTDNGGVSEKLLLETAIVERFESKKELITLEVNLSDSIEWDESWGTLDIFHKSQRIRFSGVGLYVTDLAKITKGDIIADTDRKIVTVLVPKPEVKSVTIDEDQTEYENVDRGWLRFGEIKLTPEQYNAVYDIVKDSMLTQMHSAASYEEAENSTRSNVREIFQMLVDSIEAGYAIVVDWKSE